MKHTIPDRWYRRNTGSNFEKQRRSREWSAKEAFRLHHTVGRIPAMGRSTEIILIEGRSKDDTFAQRVAGERPSRNIRFLPQTVKNVRLIDMGTKALITGITGQDGSYLSELLLEFGNTTNHESPRRGFEFVTRKITSHAAKIKLGLVQEIRLGNLDARRDWGHAKDYVRAMWLMLQKDQPDEYVVASGRAHSVREFLEAAFKRLNLDPYQYLVVDQNLVRPADLDRLVGDATKARTVLGWKPEIFFGELVDEMVDLDLKLYSDRKRES